MRGAWLMDKLSYVACTPFSQDCHHTVPAFAGVRMIVLGNQNLLPGLADPKSLNCEQSLLGKVCIIKFPPAKLFKQ